MRRLVILAAGTLICLPAFGAHRVTVAQLEEDLTSACAEHRSDAEIARMVGNLELSQRLTRVALGRLAARLPVQPRTALVLELLADQSAFLDLPPAEIPATEPPDAAQQQHMLELARGYVVETMPRLPNFFATRTVTRFDDAPFAPHPGDYPIRAGLHPVGTASHSVTFRDGKEVVDTPASADASAKPSLGLYSFGEFGPVLARTFTDLVNGKVQFNHWEQTPLGIAAVYKFEVPKGGSHYQVHFCCTVDAEFAARQAIGSHNVGRRASESNNPAEDVKLVPFDTTPAYHGYLSIDPNTGAVLRIAIEAELGSGDPIERAATVVDYGRVAIGGQDFICPTRSVAISLQQAPYAPNGHVQPPPTLSINESTFADYHRLAATVRVIADGSQPAGTGPNSSGNPAADIPALTATPAAPSQPVPGQPSGANGSAASTASASTAESGPQLAASAAPPRPAALPAPPAAPIIPEISMAAATGIPDVSTNPNGGYSLKITSHLVDVGVLVYDKHGHPVTDLKREDFELYDDGHKQDIRFFSAAAGLPEAPSEAAPATSFSNRATDSAVPLPSVSAGTILLIDEGHIAWSDLNYARGQMLKFLSKIPDDAPVGIYTMNSLGFHVLLEPTRDHAALEARLKSYMPSAQSVTQAQEEERRNRQSFDVVHSVADLNSVNGNHGDVPDAEQPVDPELLQMGSNPTRAAFIILAQVARHLAAIPGHKSLVWVSTDNALADWEDQAVAIDKSPKMVESYARRAQEAMNEAHAAVYPFDVSQLEAGGVGADLQNSNVELAPAAMDNLSTAQAAGGGGSSSGSGNGASAPSNRQTGTGRINAAMSQDLHPVQGPVRDVATGTGGRVIRRSGDLASELEGIVNDSRSTFQLSFYPQGSPDDKYHNLTVKLVGHHGLNARYRTGYLFATEPMSLKDRFRQAIWQPIDASEIGVTASVSPSGASSSIKINIAAADLAMEQQAGRWMDKLDIFFIQRDDAGIHARVEGDTLGLRLKPSTYQNLLPSGVPFERAVEMKPGMGSLRVLVVDENSGRMGSVTIPSRALLVANR